jgi:hypothetical protein
VWKNACDVLLVCACPVHVDSLIAAVGIVRCIEKLLIACASMSLDSCYSVH